MVQADSLGHHSTEEGVNVIIKNWILHYGIPRTILSNNGGEFTGEEMTEIKNLLGIEIMMTAAYSPWQNGLCEKGHQLIDTLRESYGVIHLVYVSD